jgi:hypothetical protein
MPEDIDRKLADKRVAHRYIAKGRLDEKEYEKHLKSLPDLADQAVPIESALDDDFVDEAESAPATPATEGPKEP